MVQYYEFSEMVGFPIEIYKTPLMIDGVFEPDITNNRLSLGYLVNMNRKQESLECLINIGMNN